MKLPDARVALGYGRKVFGLRGLVVHGAHRALRLVRAALAADFLLVRLFLAMPVLHGKPPLHRRAKKESPHPAFASRVRSCHKGKVRRLQGHFEHYVIVVLNELPMSRERKQRGYGCVLECLGCLHGNAITFLNTPRNNNAKISIRPDKPLVESSAVLAV